MVVLFPLFRFRVTFDTQRDVACLYSFQLPDSLIVFDRMERETVESEMGQNMVKKNK